MNQCTFYSPTGDRPPPVPEEPGRGEDNCGRDSNQKKDKTRATETRRVRDVEGCAVLPAIGKRIGTITIVFVTLLLGSSDKKKRSVQRRDPATAQSEEDTRSAGNLWLYRTLSLLIDSISPTSI